MSAPQKLPEPYRSHILHNIAAALELRPTYARAALALIWSRMAGDGLEYLPEHAHHLFNEEPKP